MQEFFRFLFREIRQKIVGWFIKKKVVKERKCVFRYKSKVRFYDCQFEGRNAISNGSHINGCKLGYASYVAADCNLAYTLIGRYSSIGPNVKVIGGEHPTRKFVSTHPAFYSVNNIINKSYVSKNLFEEKRYTSNGYWIEIGNDVWIGSNVLLKEGIKVADGTIIAAGAVVVKDTEPYSIIGGVPARLIRYRFEEEDIKFLLNLKWWNKGDRWITEHAKYFSDIKKLRKSMEFEDDGKTK